VKRSFQILISNSTCTALHLGGGLGTTSDVGGVLTAMASLAAEQGKGAAAVSLFDRAIATIESRAAHSRAAGGDGSHDDDEDTANGTATATATGTGRRGFSVTMPAKVSRAVRLARLREVGLALFTSRYFAISKHGSIDDSRYGFM
jgi:hypothetical protein